MNLGGTPRPFESTDGAMKDVFALKKPSRALQLCIQLARLAVTVSEELSDETFRGLLLDQPEELLAQIGCVQPQHITDAIHERICSLMEDAEYDSSAAARESESGLFLDLHMQIMRLRQQLQEEHAEGARVLPTTSFCVAVDGSRQSFMAFELTTRLRRQGRITIVHVNEEHGTSLQLPLISSDFIAQEYKHHCQRLQVPSNQVSIECKSSSSSVADQLLRSCERHGGDVLVLGAIGKGGPAVDQVGHVPREAVAMTSIPVLLVPPAPVNAIASKRQVFVVALDGSTCSPMGQRSVQAALKLIRPADALRLVHFYDPPIVGAFDDSAFEVYREFLHTSQLDDVALDLLPLPLGWTVAESLQDYLAQYAAGYLVMGVNGGPEGPEAATVPLKQRNRIGRVTTAMLYSPRCALCLCP